jgi:excinuclease UvrABC nuclease subunit
MEKPDMVFPIEVIDYRTRQEYGYTWKLNYKASGIYMFYEKGIYLSYLLNKKYKLRKKYLYVGKAKNLYNRLQGHIKASKWLADYTFNKICERIHLITDINIAVWYENNETERRFKEHELIGCYRPMFNKA